MPRDELVELLATFGEDADEAVTEARLRFDPLDEAALCAAMLTAAERCERGALEALAEAEAAEDDVDYSTAYDEAGELAVRADELRTLLTGATRPPGG